MRHQTWIIEARDEAGGLDLTCDQPESVFGIRAIKGMDDWEMSRVIFHRKPNAVLRGDSIKTWPSILNPRWVAREKTW